MQSDAGDDGPLLPSVRRRETTPARMMGPRQLTDSLRQRAAPLFDARSGALQGQAQESYAPEGIQIYYQSHPMQYQPPPAYYQPYGPPYSQPYPAQFVSATGVPRSSTGSQVAPISVPRSWSRARNDRESPPPPPPAAVPVVIRNIIANDSSDEDRYSEDDSIDVRTRRVMRRDRSSSRSYPPPPRVRFDDVPAPSSTVYSFTPSRLSHAASTQPSISTDEEPIPGKDEDDADGTARKEPDHAVRLLHVSKSQYKGDYTLGGSHGVELTAALSSRLSHQPLFRWLHCTRTFMDFDDFSKAATRVPGLTTIEHKGIRDLLARVRRKFVKTVQTADGRSVRHMEPACIQHVLPQDNSLKGPGLADRTVTWVCLPYISLEKYSGLQGAAENLSAFPIETLLQAKFSRTGRERDMLQAVCQSKDTLGGLCYHVAQVWCLIVGNCNRMKEETLQGDSVDLVLEPTTVERSPDARAPTTIAVSHRHTVLWSIAVDECQTWLVSLPRNPFGKEFVVTGTQSFLAHFREFWPQRLQFFHRKRTVTVDNWPKIWNLAKHSDTKITLDMRVGPSLEPPPVGILAPKSVEREDVVDPVSASQSMPPPPSEGAAGSSRRTESVPRKRGSTTLSVLPIFSCLPGVADPKDDSLDEEVLDDHLLEVEDYILSRTPFSDRRAYNACPKATRDKIHAQLEQRGVELSGATDVQREQQQDYEMRLDIFNAADAVFKFFFPSDVVVPTINKFWGALEAIINGPLRPGHSIRTTRSELRGLCVRIQLFHEIFNRSGKEERAKIAVPKEIVEGWIHLLMALVYLPKDDDKTERLLDDARILITGGMATVIRALSDKSLLDNSVFLPLELVSLISLKLLQDSTLGMPNASQCYSACLEDLAADIQSKPSDRSREYRISLLLEEISIIQRIIGDQSSIFKSLMSYAGADPGSGNQVPRRSEHTPIYLHTRKRESPRDDFEYTPYYQQPPASHSRSRSRSGSYERDPSTQFPTQSDNYYEAPVVLHNLIDPPEDFKLAPTDSEGFRVLLLNECLHFLAGRERDFSGFRSWASFLEKVNRNKIDTTKDRHDNAIYAFTIVTIVFLPLSAIASIFGMNTTGVRDMELGQWAYWAVALPVTVLVIFLGLLWTGELGNIVGWMQSFGPRRRGYRGLVEVGIEPERYEGYEYVRVPPPPRPLGRGYT
ncbi:hypothetical protein OQA88_5240 [Cercophora sp. LCS_1]